jgi:endoglycosylceramidase
VRIALATLALPFALGCGTADAPRMCALAPPDDADGRLTADGTLLRDRAGRVVTLRGVNAGGRSKFAPSVPFDFSAGGYDAALAAYLDRAQAWGIGVMRVPFSWNALEPSPGQDDATFLARYDALLDGAWARGIRTIVDFHQDVYAENFCGDGFPAWTLPDPKPAPHHDCPTWYTRYGTPEVSAAFDAFWAPGSPVRASFERMWERMATRHRDRPGVIGFEIINEPNEGSADPRVFEATTLTAFTSAMAARLHAVAPAALVFFDAVGISSGTTTTAMGRPDGDGLVFAPHYYQPTTLAAHGEGNPDAVAEAVARWHAVGTGWNLPVLLGEFGSSHLVENAAEYIGAHFRALDTHGMSGTEWEYSVSAEAWNEEVFSLVAPDGTEHPVVAAIARPYPRAVAGSAIASSYDPRTRTYSLRYIADGGVTELALPARAYPKGARLAVSGACVDRSRANRLLVRGEAGASVTVEISPE